MIRTTGYWTEAMRTLIGPDDSLWAPQLINRVAEGDYMQNHIRLHPGFVPTFTIAEHGQVSGVHSRVIKNSAEICTIHPCAKAKDEQILIARVVTIGLNDHLIPEPIFLDAEPVTTRTKLSQRGFNYIGWVKMYSQEAADEGKLTVVTVVARIKRKNGFVAFFIPDRGPGAKEHDPFMPYGPSLAILSLPMGSKEIMLSSITKKQLEPTGQRLFVADYLNKLDDKACNEITGAGGWLTDALNRNCADTREQYKRQYAYIG